MREAVAAGVVAVFESDVHERESAPRPDLGLLELLRELSGGQRLPPADDQTRRIRRRMAQTIERAHPARAGHPSDEGDLDALAIAVHHCDLVTCDAFMADVIRRLRLDVTEHCAVFTGRRGDVERLRLRLSAI